MQMTIQINRKERGQSMAELAISFTFLILILAGIADLGRAFYTFISLRDAAQEGALYGSTDPENTAAITDRVCSASNYLSSICTDPGANLQVIVDIPGEACITHAIEVTVIYQNYPITMPFAGIFMGQQTIQLASSVTDTILLPSCD
jgi:Flp pilus assembly protein TadG